MDKIRHIGKPNKKSIVMISSIIFTAVLLLMYFLPREKKFGFEYEVDRPWRYSQLIAAYDFPVFKTESELKCEKDSLLRSFRPFFRMDSSIVKLQIQNLRRDFYAGYHTGVPAYYLPRITSLLKEVYEQGIIDRETVDQLHEDSINNILILDGNVASELRVNQIYTLSTAYEHIMQKEAANYGRDLLERSHLNKYLTANIIYDKERTEAERTQLLDISSTRGMVQKGQLIIDRGQIVTPDHHKVLDSLKKENEYRMDPTQGYWYVFFGQLAFICCVIGLFVYYLNLYRKDYLFTPRMLLLLMILVTIFPFLTYMMVANNTLSIYLLPYAIVPIFVRIFYDSRTAFLAVITSSLLSSIVLYGSFEFLLLQLVSGMMAIYTLRELTERAQVLKTSAAVTVIGIFAIGAYDLAQGIAWEDLDQTRMIHVALSGVLLLFSYPLMYLVERIFGFTSSVTLVELTNINNPILRKMSKVAQGTFNHSMQVANLTAEVADKIGADPQLVRTGALYHDIGKMLNPAFFTENQSGVNPHNSLSEERSAQIIIGHVTDGMKLAEKYHLPPVIREFITTHHGAGMAKYFYIQYANKHPEEEVDKEMFTYPGPNPFTREQAILMMCDSVEAASRSLQEYTEESISNLVNKIIDTQLNDGCFKECPLTFKDIADAKRVLIESLKTVYHTRISYPELNKNKAKETTPQRPSLFGNLNRVNR